MRANVTDQCVQLGLAIVIIALVSIVLYQFSEHAGASEAGAHLLGVLN